MDRKIIIAGGAAALALIGGSAVILMTGKSHAPKAASHTDAAAVAPAADTGDAGALDASVIDAIDVAAEPGPSQPVETGVPAADAGDAAPAVATVEAAAADTNAEQVPADEAADKADAKPKKKRFLFW
jgi:hypothetical protein